MQTKTFNCLKSRGIRQAADEQCVCAESWLTVEVEFPKCGIWGDMEGFCLCRAWVPLGWYLCVSTLWSLPPSPDTLNFSAAQLFLSLFI